MNQKVQTPKTLSEWIRELGVKTKLSEVEIVEGKVIPVFIVNPPKYGGSLSPYAGVFVYDKRQTLVKTTSAQTKTLTVPVGKRWILYYAYLRNESSQTLTCYIAIHDADGNVIANCAYEAALADNGEIHVPYLTGTENVQRLGVTGYPMPLKAGQKIIFYFGAHGSATDYGYWYAHILELDEV